MVDETHRKMAKCLIKFTNKIFNILNDITKSAEEREVTFIECVKLFGCFAPVQIELIVSDWIKAKLSEYEDDKIRPAEFIEQIRKRFVAALDGFSYNARTFYMMENNIKSTINTIHNRYEVKADGSGRRSNRREIAKYEKYSLPSAEQIEAQKLRVKVPVFTVRTSAISAMKKEDRDACVLHGHEYTVRETFMENNTEVCTILIGKPIATSEDLSFGGKAGEPKSVKRSYVIFDYKSISDDGVTCLPLGMKTPMTFMATDVPIALTRGTKRDGKLVFNDGKGNMVSGRNKRSDSKRSSKYGSTECELSKLKSYVNARHEEGPVLPLIGVVENDVIVEVWSGDESEYHKTLNNLLRKTNCIVYACTRDIPTVYSVSQERKISKNSKSCKSSRFVSESEDYLANNASQLTELQTILTPHDKLKQELKALSTRELDEDDIFENARLAWLRERVDNPVEESESRDRALILSALASKVNFPDNQTRDEIIQAVKIGFGEWVHPDDMIVIEMNHRETIEIIESVKVALLFAFDNVQSLYQKLLCGLDRYFSVSRTQFNRDEEGELVVVKSLDDNNNFTPVSETKSFYKKINPNLGNRSRGHVALKGGR